MQRRLSAIASIVALILFTATLALCFRSYWVTDWVHCSWLLRANDPKAGDLVPSDTYYSLSLGDGTGCLYFGYGYAYGQNGFPEPRWRYERRAPPFDFHESRGPFWRRLGFTWDSGPDGLTGITAPFWLPAAIFFAVPALQQVRSRWRRHLQDTGRCGVCGYNLTANISGVCPECGTAITPNDEAGRK